MKRRVLVPLVARHATKRQSAGRSRIVVLTPSGLVNAPPPTPLRGDVVGVHSVKLSFGVDGISRPSSASCGVDDPDSVAVAAGHLHCRQLPRRRVRCLGLAPPVEHQDCCRDRQRTGVGMRRVVSRCETGAVQRQCREHFFLDAGSDGLPCSDEQGAGLVVGRRHVPSSRKD